MKSERRDASINEQLSCTGEENVVKIPPAKFLKDMTSEERKKEAIKPIYLVRYE